MISEFGHYALVLALVQASVPMVGARKDDPVLMAVAGPTAVVQFCFIAIAFAALTICTCGRIFPSSMVYICRPEFATSAPNLEAKIRPRPSGKPHLPVSPLCLVEPEGFADWCGSSSAEAGSPCSRAKARGA